MGIGEGSQTWDLSGYPLVGRARELDRLRGAYQQMLIGHGRLVLVSGEAGIGKTSLVQALVHEARTQETVVLGGAAYDLSVTPPYGPWLELIDRFPADPSLPELPEILKRGTGVGNLQNQTELFAFAFDFFHLVSATTPLLIVLEDLHWSDQASLDMLRYIARRLDESRILIVATYRDDEITRRHPLFQLLPSIVRESRCLRIELMPLTADDVEALVASRWRFSRADEEKLANHLLSHAGGNPLLTVELLHTLEQYGFLAPQQGGAALPELSNVPVPALVQQLIERRLATLNDDARHYLEVAAIIGHHVPLDIWQSVTEMSDDELTSVIDQTVELNLLDSTSWIELGVVRFVHALTRDALYQGVSPIHRSNWHRRIAETLAESSNPLADSIAYHFQEAGDRRAVYWLIRAGEQAERTFAWSEAFERHERAANILRQASGCDDQLSKLLLKLGRLLRFTHTQRGIDYHKESREIALRCGERAVADLALFNAGNQLCMTGDISNGLRYMSDAVNGIVANATNVRATSRWSQTMLPAEIDAVISSVGTLVSQLAFAARYREAIATAEQQLPFNWHEVAAEERQIDDASGILSFADGFWGLGIAHSALGELDRGKLAFDTCRTLLGSVGYVAHRMFVTSTVLVLYHFSFRTADLNQRRELVDDIEKHMQTASGSAGWRNTSWGYEWYLLNEGHWREMHRLIEERELPTLAVFRNTVMNARIRLAWYEGRFHDAWNLIGKVHLNGPVDECTEVMDFLQRDGYRVAAAMAIDAGEFEHARSWLQAHDAWLDRSGVVIGRAEGSLLWARLHRAEGDVELARARADQARELASVPAQPPASIAINRFRGELAISEGDYPTAAAHLERSRELAVRCALPYEQALTSLALAELEMARGDPGEARRLINDVRQVFTELGARPALKRAEKILARLPRGRGDDRFGLSRRELDVLERLVQGLSDREIADELYISPRTVMHHVSSILRKLDVDSRTAAATQAVRHDLI